MRLFIAGILQETNYFSPIPTGQESFLNQYWDPKQQSSPPDHVNLLAYGGALERAQALQIETVPSIFASAVPAAPMGSATWQSLKARILDDLLEATPMDALFLFLHGAMAAKDVDDCEGELLEAARTIVGEGVPIACVMDLHGNLSERMMRNADYVIACKEYPHVDLRDQAARAVDLLRAQVEGEVHPTSAALRVPLLTISPTTSGPVKPLVEAMRRAEDAQGVLSVSAFHGFFGADHMDVGAGIIAITDSNLAQAESVAQRLADQFIDAVIAQGQIGVDLDTALEQASKARGRVILADRADNAGGGAASDSTLLLAELLRRGMRDVALGCLWDPVAANLCHLAGVGSRIQLRLGGKIGPLSGNPLDVKVEVLAIADDIRQAWFGRGKPNLPLGKSAAIRIGGVDLVIGSLRHQVFSRHVFEGHGIDLESKNLIVVKSTQHFVEAFAPLGQIIYCDLPGTCSMDLNTLPYQRLQRPLWPLDKARPVPRPLWPPNR